MVSSVWHILVLLSAVSNQALSRSDLKEKERLSNLLGNGADACFSHWKGDSFCDKACNNAHHNFDFGDCSRKTMHFKGGANKELFQPSLKFKPADETEQIIELTKESKTKHHVDMFKNTTEKWTHVRRGQEFEIQHDKIATFFGERKWIMRLQIKDQTPLNLKINSKFIVEPIPIYAAVGIYDVSFVDARDKAYPAGQIVVLFNPYLEHSEVHGSPTLAEYIEQEEGILFWGDVSRQGKQGISQMHWRFHQFHSDIGQVALKLLDYLPVEQRGKVVEVARHFTMVLSSTWSTEDGTAGVLFGSWSGKYEDGVKPSAWTGTREIFQKYLQQPQQSVKYGQCWVFSAILTSVYRYLGIPTRSVSNFRSAHEKPPYDHLISSKEKDGSTWNFHVWVDAWMARNDLGTDLVGWNAADATPQEKSGGKYRMGPAFVPWLRANNIKKGDGNYDAAFVGSEVNALQFLHHMGHEGYDTTDIGRYLMTRQPLNSKGVDIMKEYKVCPSLFYDVVDDKKCCVHLPSAPGTCVVTKEVARVKGNDNSTAKVTQLLWDKTQCILKQLVSNSSGLISYQDDGDGSPVMQEVKLDTLKIQKQSSSSERFRSQRTSNEDDDDDVMAEVRDLLKDKRESKQGLNPKEKKLLLKTKQQLLNTKEDLLVSQEENDIKKSRRSHLQEVKYPAQISPFVSNNLEHCDEAMRRCADCFGIEKKNAYQKVDHNLVVHIQRQRFRASRGAWNFQVYFEMVSNNGMPTEDEPFHTQTIMMDKDEKESKATAPIDSFEQHLSRSLSVRVTVYGTTDDMCTSTVEQVQFSLPHPKIHGTVNAQNKEIIDVDVTINNPLKNLALTDVTVDVDSDFGDRTLTPFKIAPGSSETKTFQIATGPQGTHCAVFGVEAKEIFGLGWEGLLCYEVSADGSVKFVLDG